MAPSKRRVRPLRKPSTPAKRKRRIHKDKLTMKDGLIKALIGLVLVVDLVLIFFIVRQCSKPVKVEEPVVVQKQEEPVVLQIEVLNGCGVPGIASQFTDFLRERGFDVVKTDNYELFNVPNTVVVDRRGILKNSIRIAEALGLGEDRVVQEANEAYLIDASVVLGSDYRQLEAWKSMER